MRYLGFERVKASKGWFTDGHERADVVQERIAFLKMMEDIEPRMCSWIDDDVLGPMSIEVIPECVSSGRRRKAVLVTHDESTFYANDGKSHFWMENNKKKLLPKSSGQSIMISGFACACHGFMSGKVNGKMVKSYLVFHAGKGREGWFTNEHLVQQLDDCAALIKQLHPGADIYDAFDNSMTHRARPPDGLYASALNLSDGGKNVKPMQSSNGLKSKSNTGAVCPATIGMSASHFPGLFKGITANGPRAPRRPVTKNRLLALM